MICQLPPQYALILRGGLAPVIAHAPIGVARPGLSAGRIRGQAVAPVRALAQVERAAPRQAVPPADRWAPADRTPAAPGPAGAVNGPAAPGRLPWDAPVGGNGTNGGRDRGGRAATMATDREPRAADLSAR